MSEKITSSHLERTAYVYVRQSSMHQVRTHRESQRRQYDLAVRARQLGFARVEVIDEDLGRSGGGSQERPGFSKLVTAVCQGQAGAVFAMEASRLARNNRDWHHLVDLCTMTQTLVIDHDGVYDPLRLNDRLLLGLKGTMSEFELGLMRQRAQEAFQQKVQRGEVMREAPIGFIRTEANGMEKTPDRQVQEAIAGVFAKFRELGSARQVLFWYHRENLPMPSLCRGRGGREVKWNRPSISRIMAILKNPAYAGAFAFGRTRTQTTVKDGRARKTTGHPVPQDEWDVLICDHHPGYISWEEYERNQTQLASNRRMDESSKTGAAKKGVALLAGLLRCGRCGRKLHICYGGVDGRRPRYQCQAARMRPGRERCISFGGVRVDRAVEQAVLEALRPAGIEASLKAWEQAGREEDEKRKALRLALQRATYETDYARRQYDAVDPDNRLVAAELEKRWNEALQKQADLERRLAAEGRRTELTQTERRRLFELGDDLERLWHHPEASASLKKRIVRTLIEEIVADVTDYPPEIQLRVHWAGGVHTLLTVPKSRSGEHGRATDRKVIELVRKLAEVCDDKAIAAILNRLGCQTGAGNTWTKSRVNSLRTYHGIAIFDPDAERSWLTLNEAAVALDVSPTVIRRLIRQKILPAKQAIRYAPWVIERKNLDRQEVLAAVQDVKEGKRRPRTALGQTELPLKSRKM